MKRILVVLTVWISVGSCTYQQQSRQMEEASAPYQFTESEADTLYKYLRLVDSAYVFTLSKEEAMAKGVTARGYAEMEECLLHTNQGIREAIENGKQDMSLFDPQNVFNRKKEDK